MKALASAAICSMLLFECRHVLADNARCSSNLYTMGVLLDKDREKKTGRESATVAGPDVPAAATSCSTQITGERVTLESPAFAFALDVTDTLRAVTWENRLTGRTLNLGNGPEVEFDIGLPDQPLVAPKLRVTGMPAAARSSDGEAVFTLVADEPVARVTVTYRWNATEPVLRKFVSIENGGRGTWNRLLNIRLGDYATGTAKLTGGELIPYPPSFRARAHCIGGLQGFPVYAEDEFFLSLAHPAGWTTQEPGKVSLRHYPGAVLKPGERRDCMEAVYGVGAAGEGRASFVTHLRGRMRRIVRGHDRPYAIFEPFGGRTEGTLDDRNRSFNAMFASGSLFEEDEPYLLDMIAKVAEGQRNSAGGFDFLSIDFWVDNKGDIKRADPVRFPTQFERIKAVLRDTGITPGLWIDSSSCGWSVGGNPAAMRAIVQDVPPDFCDRDRWQQWRTLAYFCRATEPIRSMYTEGFLHHIRENGVRLLKFDNFASQCSNPAHDHLPGLHGNEATHEAVIECYRAFDAACPDVFIMLYWGHRSPWWLLHADTIFETGIEMEAASPGHMPAPYARDGVTRKIDQGHQYAREVPWLGTDSLGVWLSHWGGWNSGIGTERWQEGFVMDICRGHALAQPWTDPSWLTPPERQQVHEFIALMKAQPACFTQARLILGDPWKDEPYGYSCSDGQRAFLAINNGTWEDRVVPLKLGPAWGLPPGGRWDLFRWYPNQAKLVDKADGFADDIMMAMRPFEVVLLEAVPHGGMPSLGKEFAEKTLPREFSESSRALPLAVRWGVQEAPDDEGFTWPGLGSFALPAACTVFAPCAPGTDMPTPESLKSIPAVLELGGQRIEGRQALFDSERVLDLAAFIGDLPPRSATVDSRPCAWVYLPFTSKEDGPAMFGFGADWWYEAYLDGVLISETVTQGGNLAVRTGLGNHGVTVNVVPGRHLLVLRLIPGSASAKLAAGGPLDLRQSWLRTPVHAIQGEIPSSAAGGMLTVVLELADEAGKAVEWGDLGSFFAVEATVDGRPAQAKPAIGPLGHPSSWQTWRLAVEPGSPARRFALRITGVEGKRKWSNKEKNPAEMQHRFSAHFLPQS